jgi:hypothetical protein
VAGAGRGRVSLVGELAGSMLCGRKRKRGGKVLFTTQRRFKTFTGEDGVAAVIISGDGGSGIAPM